jgi:oligoendopeptidase F
MRCYGLCEYRYGNRMKWIQYLEKALKANKLDAEVIYNLIEIYLLEHRNQKAARLISYYTKNREKMHIVDKTITFYDEKIQLFEQFLKTQATVVHI